MKQLGSWIKLALKFAFSFGIIFYMVISGRLDLSVVKHGFSQFPVLAISFSLVLCSMASCLYRWGLLMRAQNIDFTFAQLIRYGMIGAFFNTTMPGAVSGDIIKVWYVLADRKGQRKTPVLTSVLLDRVLGVFGLILVSVSPILFFWSSVWAVPELRAVSFVVLLLALGVLFFFAYILLSFWGPLAWIRQKLEVLNGSKMGKTLLGMYDSWMHYRNHPGILFKATLLSIGNFLGLVMVAILCDHALGDQNIALFQYFLLVPVGLLTTAIPVAPAGLGVGHVAFAALFKLVGSNHGAEVFTMVVTLQIVVNLIGVIFYLTAPKLNAKHELATD